MKEVWKEWAGYGAGKRGALIHTEFRNLNRGTNARGFKIDYEVDIPIEGTKRTIRPDVLVSVDMGNRGIIPVGVIDLKTGGASFQTAQIDEQRMAAAVKFNRTLQQGKQLSPADLEALAASMWSDCVHVQQFPPRSKKKNPGPLGREVG